MRPAASGVFAHYSRQHGITVWWQMESAYGWASPYYDYGAPDNSPHSFILPHGFLDGHVQAISTAQMQDANTYGPAGSIPLWLLPFW